MTFHRTMHTVTADKAIAYIKSHGHFATITKEGILATSWEGSYTVPDTKHPDGDHWVEAMYVFPLDDDGRASSRAICAWLGY